MIADIFAGLILGLASILSVVDPAISYANDSHLVRIFADGEERAVRVEAETVKEALNQAEVELGSDDLVEPGLLTAISNDNFNINVYRARPVMIVDEDRSSIVMSAYQSPRLIVEHAGIEIYDEDEFSEDVVADIIEQQFVGLMITIDRAVPLSIEVDGQTLEIRTQNETVGEVLDEQGIVLESEDELSHERDERIKDGMTIEVMRVGYETMVEEVETPFDETVTYDSSKPQGWSQVITKGKMGIKLITYKAKLVDGEIADKEILQEVTKRKPTTQVAVRGNLQPGPADTGGNMKLGQEMAAKRGWTGDEWSCLYHLWAKESGWDHLKYNYAGSGAYGIPQALPGSKMSSHGSDWKTNPATQIAWGLDYIAGRYGSPCGAWDHSTSRGWY